MSEHNKTYYSLEELKRARDCYEGYQDGEEVYYFVGALRYACDEIERLNNEIKTLLKENGNKEKVIIAQDNIIKEFEDFITNVDSHINLGDESEEFILVRDKWLELQELKGSDKE